MRGRVGGVVGAVSYRSAANWAATQRPICLMDLATIGARYLRKMRRAGRSGSERGEQRLLDLSSTSTWTGSPKSGCCSSRTRRTTIPTEIEPFGGASTCLGGAIRDPLSGRSYVYQAMRVTGAGDIYQPVGETLAGKLPQAGHQPQGCGRLFELRQPDRSGHDPRARISIIPTTWPSVWRWVPWWEP